MSQEEKKLGKALNNARSTFRSLQRGQAPTPIVQYLIDHAPDLLLSTTELKAHTLIASDVLPPAKECRFLKTMLSWPKDLDPQNDRAKAIRIVEGKFSNWRGDKGR